MLVLGPRSAGSIPGGRDMHVACVRACLGSSPLDRVCNSCVVVGAMPRPQPLPHEVALMRQIDNLQRKVRRQRSHHPPIIDLVTMDEIARLKQLLEDLRALRN